MHKRVLVVEDDKSIRETMGDALEMLGYQASLAANGQEALDHLAKNGNPCLILLDLMMPVMDGWEFHSRVKQAAAHSEVPIVLISADGNTEKKARQMGLSRGLSKPIDFEELKALAQRYCG